MKRKDSATVLPQDTSKREASEENSDALKNSLEKILALQPVSWRWKDTRAGEEIQYGFIAQEVEKVLPELVSEQVWIDGSKRKFLTTAHLTPYLIEALKEQDQHIDDTTEQVMKLLTTLQEMQKQINDLQEKLKLEKERQ